MPETSPIEKPLGSRTHFGPVDPTYSKRREKKKARTNRRGGIPRTARPPLEVPVCRACEKTLEGARAELANLGEDRIVDLSVEKIREERLKVERARQIVAAVPPYGPKVRLRLRIDGKLETVWACPRHDSVDSDEQKKRIPLVWSLPNRFFRRLHGKPG